MYKKYKTCPRQSYVSIWKYTGTDAVLKTVPIQCKTWSCPVCSESKVIQLRNKLEKFFKDKPLSLITLTVKYYGQGPFTASTHIKKSFSRLRKMINRRYDNFPYVYFVETHKHHQTIHYHLLTTLSIRKYKLKNLWKKASRNSYQADISSHGVKHGILKRYAIKYVQKQAFSGGGIMLYGQKIYSYSSHFFNPPRGDSDWTFLYMETVSHEAMCKCISISNLLEIDLSQTERSPPVKIKLDSTIGYRFILRETSEEDFKKILYDCLDFYEAS